MMRTWAKLVMAALVIVPLFGVGAANTHAQAGERTFPETGKSVQGLFLNYWQEHGGLAQQGFPISGEIQERSPVDGKTYRVQYFERAVFEHHPEYAGKQSEVLLSLLGSMKYAQKYPSGAPDQKPNTSAGSVLFKETGKRLGGRFMQYWQGNGGLMQQGYPISDEFTEKSELDGKTYTVQYFERAVFEHHPENKAPHDVLLSQLGTYRLHESQLSSRPPGSETPPGANGKALMEQAQKANPQRYQYALDNGAQFGVTKDGKSFYIYWSPSGDTAPTSPSAARTIVTLHGSSSWAFDEFFLWHPHAQKRGYSVLALQWWFGTGEGTSDYYTPEAMHEMLRAAMMERGVSAETAILHGFSRGSANVYGLTFLDRRSGDRYFHFTIANAGGAAPDYPINQMIERNMGPVSPFGGSKWVMYCGANDPNPEQSGCPAMQRSRDWVKQYGGAVVQLIEDPTGGHGGFHQNPANVELALDLIAQNW